MVDFSRNDLKLERQLDGAFNDNPFERAFNAGAYDYIDPDTGLAVKEQVTAHHIIPISVLEGDSPNQAVVDMLIEIEQYTGLAYDANAVSNGIYLPNTVDAALLGGAANNNFAALHDSGHPAYIEFVNARLNEIQVEYESRINAEPDANRRIIIAGETFGKVTALQESLKKGLISNTADGLKFFLGNNDPVYQHRYGNPTERSADLNAKIEAQLGVPNPDSSLMIDYSSGATVTDNMNRLFYDELGPQLDADIKKKGRVVARFEKDPETGRYVKVVYFGGFSIAKFHGAVDKASGNVGKYAMGIMLFSLAEMARAEIAEIDSLEEGLALLESSNLGLAAGFVADFLEDMAIESAISLAARLLGGPFAWAGTAYEIYENYSAMRGALEIAEVAFPGNSTLSELNDWLASMEESMNELSPYKDQNSEELYGATYGTGTGEELMGTANPDTIFGEGGSDTIRGAAGNDQLYGGEGDDHLLGHAGEDKLFGGAGNDHLTGGWNNDELEGGAGNDTYYYETGDGNDVIRDLLGNDILVINGNVISTITPISEGASVFEDEYGNRYVLSSEGKMIITVSDGVRSGTITLDYFEESLNNFGITIGDSVRPQTTDQGSNTFVVGTGDGGEVGHDVHYLANWRDSSQSGYEWQNFINQSSIQYDASLYVSNANNSYLGYAFETFQGGYNNDYLKGGDSADWLEGNDGDDTIEGGSALLLNAFNVLQGQLGSDIIRGGDQTDWIFGNSWQKVDYYLNPIDTYLADDENGNDYLIGAGGADVISGDEGDDYIDGGTGEDTIGGGEGADVIVGGSERDQIWGDSNLDIHYNYDENHSNVIGLHAAVIFETERREGVSYDDVISGGDGHDLIFGEIGNDIISGDAGDDHIYGDREITFEEFHMSYNNNHTNDSEWFVQLDMLLHGDDRLSGGAGNDQITGGGGKDYITGDEGDDRIWGDDPRMLSEYQDDDTIFGGDGADMIFGGGGDDTVDGGVGNDTIYGDDADLYNGFTVTLEGSYHGNDKLTGGYGNDTIIGGGGDDIILGGDGQDFLYGDSLQPETGIAPDLETIYHGNDSIYGGSGDDYIVGGAGDDYLSGGADNDRIYGGLGNDTLVGGDGNDAMYGGAGNDTLLGGAGSDLLDGGLGNDTYVYQAGNGVDSIDDHSGVSTLVLENAASASAIHVQQNDSETLLWVGGNQNDLVVFDNAAFARLGKIVLATGEELSELKVVLDASATTATATQMHTTFILPPEVETLPIVTSGNSYSVQASNGLVNIYTTSNNETIRGSSAQEVIWFSPGGGTDSVSGLEGNDVVRIDGNGIVGSKQEIGPGVGVYIDELGYQYTINISGKLVISFGSGDQAASITITDFDREANNYGILLEDSVLAPSETAVNLAGTNSNETLVGSGFNDVINAQEGNDYVFGLGGNDRLSGGIGDDHLYGGDGNDHLYGDTSAYDLSRGNDVLVGGKGDDYLAGGEGSDTYVIGLGDGSDVVHDFHIYNQFNFIQFGVGISSADINFIKSSDGRDLILIIGDSGQQVSIRDFYYYSGDIRSVIEPVVMEIRFYDGEVWNKEDLISRVPGRISESSDYVNGSSVNDVIHLLGGDDRVFANDGDDEIYGGKGNDELSGGAGNDDFIFTIGDGADVVIGGEGSDQIIINGVLTGGEIYECNIAPGLFIDKDGNRFVLNALGQLVIQYGSGSDQSTILVKDWNAETNDFGITLDSSVVSVPPYDVNFVPQLSSLEFSGGIFDELVLGSNQIDVIDGNQGNDVIYGIDGDDTLKGDWGDDTLYGGSGNDTLDGSFGNDVLVGGGGNDKLIGSLGSDTYQIALGDGVDTISDYRSLTDANIIEFGAGVAKEDVQFTKSSNSKDLILSVGDTGQNVIISDFYSRSYDATNPIISEIRFANGDVWSKADLISLIPAAITASNDWVVGSAADDVISSLAGNDIIFAKDGNDTLIGGSGNDDLRGENGDDLFVFNDGDGSDTVFGGAGVNRLSINGNAISGEINESAYQSGVYLDASGNRYSVNATAGWLVVNYGEGEFASEIRVMDWDAISNNFGITLVAEPTPEPEPTPEAGPAPVLDPVEAVGTDASEVFLGSNGTDTIDGKKGDDVIYGFGGNDTLKGDWGDDTIYGGDGNDIIEGYIGNDILIGGLGNDSLSGSIGSDTYRIAVGDGADTITDSTSVVDVNAIEFGEGIAQGDISFSKSSNGMDLVINIESTGQSVTVKYFYGSSYDPSNPVVNEIRFANGDVWSKSDLIGMFPAAITASNDWVYGTASSDVISTLSGNDVIWAGVGDDTLYGNEGNDQLYGEAGNDTLLGGSGNDILNGGGGDDTFVFSTGDGLDYVTGGAGNNKLRINDVLIAGEAVETGYQTGIYLDAQGCQYHVSSTGLLVVTYGSANQSSSINIWDWNSETNDFGIQLVAAPEPVIDPVPIPVSSPVTVSGTDASEVFLGSDSADTIDGKKGNDVIYGFDGDDTLKGDWGDDTIYGGDGNDTIDGYIGNDILVGGLGNDSLSGSIGSDTYRIAVGDGVDSITDSTSAVDVNAIEFGDGISQGDISFSKSLNGMDLVINIGNTGQSVTVKHFYGSSYDPSNPIINEIRFSNGNVWSKSDLIGMLPAAITASNDWVYGSAADDVIDTLTGNDVIWARGGNDTVLGGEGNDQLYGEAGNDVLTGGNGNDTLNGGADDDTLTANAGTDFLYGGAGNDQFVVHRGDGTDYVMYSSSDNNNQYTDTLVMADSIDKSEIWFAQSGTNLNMYVLGSSDRVIASKWFDGAIASDSKVVDRVEANGYYLDIAAIDQLVSAMASFGTVNYASPNFTSEQQATIDAIITEAWRPMA